MPAEALLDDRVDKWQRIAVGEVRKTIFTHDRIQFGLPTSLCIRVDRHREEERAEVTKRLGH